MAALVVDTSVWVEALRGAPLPELDAALREGMVVLPPLVAAELLSGHLSLPRRASLTAFLRRMPLHPTPFEHWKRVGALRAHLARAGVAVTIPDAHVAQCAIEVDGRLWTRDRVFVRIAGRAPVRLMRE